MTNSERQGTGNRDLWIGLVLGGVVGTALGLYLAPRLKTEFGARLTDSAKRVGLTAVERFDQVSTRVGDAMTEVSKTAQTLREQVTQVGSAVTRGVEEARRRAEEGDTERV